MNQYFKRDVQLALDQLNAAIKSANDLNTIQPTREMSITLTHLQTGKLWLKEVLDRTMETA